MISYLLFSVILVLSDVQAQSNKLISVNVWTGERFVRDLSRIAPPSRIYRSRVTMRATKMIMGVRYTGTQIFDFYQFRVRWLEPMEWNDNFDDSSRFYELTCWVETPQGEQKNIFSRTLPGYYNGYTEKLRFPPDLDVTVQCKIRATNSADLSTSWHHTNTMRVMDIPIYLPGIEGIDLRGFTEQDILSVLGKIENEIEAQG